MIGLGDKEQRKTLYATHSTVDKTPDHSGQLQSNQPLIIWTYSNEAANAKVQYL